MEITFLGSGTSHGVPSIDCMINNYTHCPKNVCKESLHDHFHRRTRCSIHVHYKRNNIIIDVSPDFRYQILREKIRTLDAVFITHCHADHIGGIPDIRSFTRDSVLPVYGSDETIAVLKNMYGYIFGSRPKIEGGGIPNLKTHIVKDHFTFNNISVQTVPVYHGSCTNCIGYQFGPMAYIPDLKNFKATSVQKLRGIPLLIIDALRDVKPHATHMILPESIAIAQDLGAKNVIFTHMSHNIHYQIDKKLLPHNMHFAYDGMKVTV